MSTSTRQGNARRRFIRLAASAAVGVPASWSSLTRAVMAGPVVTHWQGIALGAHTSIALVHQDEEQSRRVLRAAIDEIERLEQLFSLYRRDSAVVRLNQQGRLAAPSPDLLVLLGQVASINRATEGAFDPTVQAHWNARTSLDVVSDVSEYPRWNSVRYDTTEVSFRRPGMAITLNGIAQGYVTERIANLFREHGYRDVLVDIGEVAAMGHRADGKPWKVGIAERQDGIAEDSLSLTDLAIATSAPLDQRFDTSMVAADTATGVLSDVVDGHIINPETAARCASPWRRLSVVHRSATVADGLSTGLIMHDKAGIERALTYYPGARVLAVSNQGVPVDVNG